MADKERIQDEALESVAGGSFTEGYTQEHLKEVKKGLSSTIEALGDLVVKTAKMQHKINGTGCSGANVANSEDASGGAVSPSVGMRHML